MKTRTRFVTARLAVLVLIALLFCHSIVSAPGSARASAVVDDTA